MADTLVLGTSVFDVQVQVLSPAPRRRGLCIVRDDFSFEKSSAHSRRLSSFPQKVTLATAVRL